MCSCDSKIPAKSILKIIIILSAAVLALAVASVFILRMLLSVQARINRIRRRTSREKINRAQRSRAKHILKIRKAYIKSCKDENLPF